MENEALLDIRGLKTHFYGYEGIVRALDGVNLTIKPETIFGLVGESGCGKSVTALSVIRLVRFPPGKITGGQILFEGKDLLQLSEKEMRRIRGARISMIFQDPMTSLNPIARIGNQMEEVIRIHRHLSQNETEELARNALAEVDIPDPDRILRQYPYELSGGMRQRIMTATALALQPRLLIADEPTTALDVTIQAQVLDLMVSLAKKKRAAILLITHDLGVVAEYCEQVSVMYAGVVVEAGDVHDIFESCRHPYTMGLLRAAPDVSKESMGFWIIPGSVPNLIDPPPGCRFHPRCDYAMPECAHEAPPIFHLSQTHQVACWLARGNGLTKTFGDLRGENASTR